MVCGLIVASKGWLTRGMAALTKVIMMVSKTFKTGKSTRLTSTTDSIE